MDVRVHFKNGASSKSQRNRGNPFRKACFGLLAFCVILSSCSSPEKDGIKVAKMMYHCGNDYDVALNNAYKSYIKNFNFETRIDARGSLRESRQKVEENYQECGRKAVEYHNKLKSKYLTNKDKTEKFEYAFRNASNDDSNKRLSSAIQQEIDANKRKIEEVILSVIPPKPDLERLKNDLIGRSIYHADYGLGTKIRSHDNLQMVEILNATDSEHEYLLDVHLLVQGQFHQYETKNANLKYVLPNDKDDWEIGDFRVNDLIIDHTGKYDNCISFSKYNWVLSKKNQYQLTLINSCDAPLVVAGEVKEAYSNNWKRFNTRVPANSTEKITNDHAGTGSGWTRNTPVEILDYIIHFIGQPEN